MKSLTALVFLIAGLAAGTVMAADGTTSSTAPAAKKAGAKKPAHAKHEAPAADDDDKEPDVSGLQPVAYHCELGNKVTIYQYPGNEQEIALQWNKRVHHMTRVGTTTGANRFENLKKGLVWIGIPAKSILLDSKKGQQLANECKSPEQMAPKMTEVAAPKG
jgi:hypothetical protein